MSGPLHPYLIDTCQLQDALGDIKQNRLLVLHVGSEKDYLEGHIPGATLLDIAKLNRGGAPITGLLPTIRELETTFRSAGLKHDQHVVVYDTKLGQQAARCMWVLEACGFTGISWLNGGYTAWVAEGREIDMRQNEPLPSRIQLTRNEDVIADRDLVYKALENPQQIILDARSPEEHAGLKSASERKGRIPGSINFNWLETMSKENHSRLKSPEELTASLNKAGIKPDKEIIVHCQTHQRSAHSFVMLRSLGYKNVRGYAGSWSEWSSDLSNPIDFDANTNT